MAKEGSTIGGLMDAFGTSVSMSLQYGVPLEDYVRKFSHMRFEPQGYTKNPDIRIAKSLIDYIFRWLGITFLPGYKEASMGVLPSRSRRADSPRLRRGFPDDGSQQAGGQKAGGQSKSTKPQTDGRENRVKPQGGNEQQTPAPAPGSSRRFLHDEAASQRPTAIPTVMPTATRTATPTATATAKSAPHCWPAPASCPKTPAPTRPAASNSPISNRTPRPATTAAAITVRAGNCYLCHNCGSSMGCS